MIAAVNRNPVSRKRMGYLQNILHNPVLYLMALPVILYYVIFCFLPMYGVVIAFQDYVPARGVAESDWVGLKHFSSFFSSSFFSQITSQYAGH